MASQRVSRTDDVLFLPRSSGSVTVRNVGSVPVVYSTNSQKHYKRAADGTVIQPGGSASVSVGPALTVYVGCSDGRGLIEY